MSSLIAAMRCRPHLCVRPLSSSRNFSTTAFARMARSSIKLATFKHRKITPQSLTHYLIKAITDDRNKRGVGPVADWDDFCANAVEIRGLLVGDDDPLHARYTKLQRMREERRRRIKNKPKKVETVSERIDSHPYKHHFTTATTTHDPSSVVDGLMRVGAVKASEAKAAASAVTYRPRAPVVTIMGHVDHGKTLLDYLRRTSVAAGEPGGITQSIGAFRVKVDDADGPGYVTFIDTPGHAAFSEMRKVGAAATDVIVLIIAASDGIQPQTVEVLELAKSLNIPYLIAFNKIDRQPNYEPLKMQLETEHGVQFDGSGGDVICCGISAIDGTGVDELLNFIMLQSELCELQTPTQCRAEITVIDSRTPTAKKEVSGVVRCGVVKSGQCFAVGTVGAKIRTLTDETGNEIKEAECPRPVVLHGFTELPPPGSVLVQHATVDAMGKYISLMKFVGEGSSSDADVRALQQMSAKTLTQKLQGSGSGTTQASSSSNPVDGDDDDAEELPPAKLLVIPRAGTFGQLHALLSLIYALPPIKGVTVEVRHSNVGGVTLGDATMFGDEDAVIFLLFGDVPGVDVSFNETTTIEQFKVVYHGIDKLKEKIVSLLPRRRVDTVLTEAVCQAVFRASQADGGNAGGMMVRRGPFRRNGETYRIVRSKEKGAEPETVWEGTVKDLRRFKDAVPRVEAGQECGVIVTGGFAFQEGDLLQEVDINYEDLDVNEVFEAAEKEERETKERQAHAEQQEE